MRQACAVGSVIVSKSIHRIRVDGRKRCENATSGQEFYWKTEKESWVFKRIRIRVDRASGKTWKIKAWNRTTKQNYHTKFTNQDRFTKG